MENEEDKCEDCGDDCTCDSETETILVNETENMELFKEDEEFVLDLAARGITINLEKDEVEEIKKLLDIEL